MSFRLAARSLPCEPGVLVFLVMVGYAVAQAFGAKKLFHENNAREFVGKGHCAQAQKHAGLAADFVAQPVGAADDKGGNALGPQVEFLHQQGKLS